MTDNRHSYYKYCIVPLCPNTTAKSKGKIYFNVPKDPKTRKKWTKAMKRDEKANPALSNKSTLFCCEDHFSLEDDMLNYMQWRLTKNVKIKLKPGVVPHRFQCQKKNYTPPIERKGAQKRKHLSLINEALSTTVASTSNLQDEPSSKNLYSILQERLKNSKKICKETKPDTDSAESNLLYINTDDIPELSLDCDQEDNKDLIKKFITGEEAEEKEEHPHLVLLNVNENSSLSSTPTVQPRSSLPSRNNWEGPHNFKIKINPGEAPRRSETSVFSETQNKLFIVKDSPFKVLIEAENVPTGSVIKATAIFSLLEHAYEVVQRCPTHAQQDYVKGSPAFEHFVQCFNKNVVYEKNLSTGKLSVSVPYEKPQEGETYSTYLFKLTCFSSCSGGLNRRPFSLVFTLEKNNIPLGRQVLDAKVCACPLRDYKTETEKAAKGLSQHDGHTDILPQSLKPTEEKSSTAAMTTTSAKYSIAVRDLELYLFLNHMKVLYEASRSFSRTIIPDS